MNLKKMKQHLSNKHKKPISNRMKISIKVLNLVNNNNREPNMIKI